MDSSAMIRQNLQDRLLHAVKQVQVYFGARQEIATESDVRVSTLCTEWEAVLLHGHRKIKPKRTSKVIGQSTLWPLAKLALSPEELHRFLRLENAQSEIGRGRAWLRAAINERTLENYLHSIISCEQELRGLYFDSAFLLDQERSSMLPVMAAGLSSIIFSIPTDADYLNTSALVDVPPEATPPLAIDHTPSIMDRMAGTNDLTIPDHADDVVAITEKRKKKGKKSRNQPFNPSTKSSDEKVNSEPLAQSNHDERVTSEHLTQSSHQRVNNKMLGLPIPSTIRPITPPLVDVGMVKTEMDTLSIGESVSSSSSKLSINEEVNPPIMVALETGLVSHDPATKAAVNATALVLSATTGQPVEGVRDVEHVEGVRSVEHVEVGVSSGSNMSTDELREAVLVLVRAKEELTETNRGLQEQITKLESSRVHLLADLEASTNEIKSMQDSHTAQLTGLERENDLLREQLKKYVGMVQRQETGNPPDSTPSKHDQKLAEMAEMYGELMELNERLHKTVAGRDALIATLVASMRQAGMELPVSNDRLPSAALQSKALMDVWIPSVIKKGRGPDAHHVYQVFLRVQAEEWNVYRRYAEFREFHLQLMKHLPQVNTFDFPPRKTRNKSSQVVEERRVKLQDYLRQVVQLCSTTSLTTLEGGAPGHAPILQSNITKATLVHLFPFFREDLYVNTQRPTTPSYSGL